MPVRPKQRQEIHVWPVLSDNTFVRDDSWENVLHDPEETWHEVLAAANSEVNQQQKAKDIQTPLAIRLLGEGSWGSRAVSPSDSLAEWKTHGKESQIESATKGRKLRSLLDSIDSDPQSLDGDVALSGQDTHMVGNEALSLSLSQFVQRLKLDSPSASSSDGADLQIPSEDFGADPKLVPPSSNVAYTGGACGGASVNASGPVTLGRQCLTRLNPVTLADPLSSPVEKKKLLGSSFTVPLGSPIEQKGFGASRGPHSGPQKRGQLSSMLEHKTSESCYASPNVEVNSMEQKLAEMQDVIARLNKQCAQLETLSIDAQVPRVEEQKDLLIQHSKIMQEAGSFLDEVDREPAEVNVMSADDQHGLDELRSLVGGITDGHLLRSFRPPPSLLDQVNMPTIPQLRSITVDTNGVLQVPLLKPPVLMGPPVVLSAAHSFTFGAVQPPLAQNVGPCYLPQIGRT